ncbi:MAG TPA: hypothetical protein VG501_10610 [Rhizomicrobium sp.]|nr:hypothetical protein [Rhizomicrobium sp.]
MKPWSALLAISAAAAIAGPLASAAESDTGSALKCLLDGGNAECRQVFVAAAAPASRPWVYPNQNLRFNLGPLVSATYVRSISGAELYKVRLISWPAADVYDVKFQHQEKTFYISPPEADGKIRYLAIHDGSPDDDLLYTAGHHGPL